MSPRIENSDRGITLNKSLAWTVAVALVSAGVYVGTELATLNSGVNTLKEQRATADTARIAIEARVRALEAFKSGAEAVLRNLERGLESLQRDQRENNELLRQLLNRLE